RQRCGNSVQPLLERLEFRDLLDGLVVTGGVDLTALNSIVNINDTFATLLVKDQNHFQLSNENVTGQVLKASSAPEPGFHPTFGTPSGTYSISARGIVTSTVSSGPSGVYSGELVITSDDTVVVTNAPGGYGINA